MAGNSLIRLNTGLWIIPIGIVLSVFLLLSFFNCPQSDDYYYSLWMRDWGFADSNITIYFGWGGRYFSNILLTLFNPLSYSTDYQENLIPYQLHSVFHILLLCFSGKILCQRIEFVPNPWLVLVPIIFFFQKAASLNEFLYWFAGTATYCSGVIYGLLALSAAIDLRQQSKAGIKPSISLPKKPFTQIFLILSAILIVVFRKNFIALLNAIPLIPLILITAAITSVFAFLNSGKLNSANKTLVSLCFSVFASAGCSEIAGVILVICFGLFFLLQFRNTSIRDYRPALPLVISMVALGANILAPSTANREGTVNPALINNVAKSLESALEILSGLIDTIPCIATALILSLLYRKHSPEISKNEIAIQVGAGLAFCLMICGILPFALWMKAGELPGRAINVLQIVSFLTLFLVFFQTGSLIRKWIPQIGFRGLAALQMILPASLFFTPGTNNIRLAIEDLSSGQARGFYREYCKEQEAIRNCREKVCELDPMHFKPKIISSSSNAVVLGEDPPAWVSYKNNSYAAYFGKKEIIRQAARRNEPKQ